MDSAPCRSCYHEQDEKVANSAHHLDAPMVLLNRRFISIGCALGHRPESYTTYGENSQEDGECICTHYRHVGFQW